MPRKRLHPEAALSGAEKQKRFREKRKAELAALRAAHAPAAETAPEPDTAAIREQVKKELIQSWEPDLKKERLAAERKKGRELAKRADQNRSQGRTAGICEAAGFFIGMDRADLAQFLLSHFMITRETATAALEDDKRTKSLTLESLDKARAWNKPPKIIK